MNLDMEYRKGILFIRIDGEITRKNIYKLNEEIIPVVLKHGLKYIVLNLEKVSYIDELGIDTLINLNTLVKRSGGESCLCNLINEKIKITVNESKLNNMYKTKNELSALELFKV